MILRSLDKDPETIGTGRALQELCSPGIEVLLDTSTPERLDFFDAQRRRWFSIQGTRREINLLAAAYALVGPDHILPIWQTVPAHYTDLIARTGSDLAYHQGLTHALTLNRIEIPSRFQEPGLLMVWLSWWDIHTQ